MTIPKVSVILTTFNRFDLLIKAIDSVLQQTYQNIELIVVDDASTCLLYKTLVSYPFFTRITYIRHSINKGLAISRNTGILHSSGDFICFLDDDDSFLPHKLSLQIRQFLTSPPSVGVISCDSQIISDSSTSILRCQAKGFFFHKMLIGQPLGNGSTLMFSRDCIHRIGLFDPYCKRGVDGEYLLRVSLHFTCDYVPLPLVNYHFKSDLPRITDNLSTISLCRDIKSILLFYRVSIFFTGFYSQYSLRLALRLSKRFIRLRRLRFLFILWSFLLRHSYVRYPLVNPKYNSSFLTSF